MDRVGLEGKKVGGQTTSSLGFSAAFPLAAFFESIKEICKDKNVGGARGAHCKATLDEEEEST